MMNPNEYENKILVGDALNQLRQLPDKIAQLVITSPPYFQQHQYQENEPSEIGQENTCDGYIAKLLAIFEECIRITKDNGSIVFNLGDKYYKGGLMLVPARFAIGAIDKYPVDLINEVRWVKSNPTPHPDRKRLTAGHEPFYHFVKKNQNYLFSILDLQKSILKAKNAGVKTKSKKKTESGYFDMINTSDLTEEQKINANKSLQEVLLDIENKVERNGKVVTGYRMKIKGKHKLAYGGQNGGRNTQILKQGFSIIRCYDMPMIKDVIECPVESIKGIKHPAPFPQTLIERFISICTNENDLIFDPFMGSGTTALAALTLNRKFTGVELCPEFAKGAELRLEMFKKTTKC